MAATADEAVVILGELGVSPMIPRAGPLSSQIATSAAS
jgi:hypothetical protein